MRRAGLIFMVCMLVVCILDAWALAQEAPAPLNASATPAVFEIHGIVKAGNMPLPGVAVSAAHSLTGKKVLTSTDVDGSYRLVLPSRGKYVVRVELTAFAPQTAEVVLKAEAPSQKNDFALVLLSKAPKPEDSTQAAQQLAGVMSNARGVQRLGVTGDQSAMESANGSGGDSPLAGMPSMASSADAGTQSVAVAGQMGASQDFGMRSLEDLRDRIEDMRANGQITEMGGGPGGGGFGGPGGFGGGPGGGPGTFVMGGPGGMGGQRGLQRFNSNRPHGSLYYSAGNSVLDAAPYALNGDNAGKPDYGSNRFGASLGGPLVIPHLFNGGNKNFFFLNYTGTRASTPFVAYSQVPTLAERSGDFSGVPIQLHGPGTFGNQVTKINDAALALLNYIPEPNQTGQQNFRFASSADTSSDNLSARFVHNFGAASSQRAGGAPPPGGGGFGGPGGGGRGGRAHNNLNFGFNYSRNNSDLLTAFPTVGGTTKSEGWNVNGGWSLGKRRFNNTVRVSWNALRLSTGNRNTGVTNVAGQLGITGASTNSSDWGVPGLTFANFTGLSDVAAQNRKDQTLQFSEQLMLLRGKHTVRMGADYRRLFTDTHSNSNPNGTFTFTGFATGYDFADFLLGYAQQTAIQYSPYTFQFRANSWDAFVVDDWRVLPNVTINAGLRYEYQGPYTELHNRLVNLDVAPNFTAADAVLPGATGVYNGAYPLSLVRSDGNNFAPRVGVAWKIKDKTVVRAGYGINYNLGQYRSIVSQLALQPPFSFTQTNIATLANPLTFTSGFPTPETSTLTNNYGVDPNYKLGYVQLWNLNVQRELPGSLLLNVGYTGSKGTGLDIVRAPNRGPDGLRIPGVQAFLWESSGGSSILHSGSVRLRKRMKNGLSIGGTYVYAKSIDNASSIGGGATVVAQNDLDLAAERGLSSFNQAQKFTGDWLLELPFGSGKRWLDKPSLASRVFGDWTLSGDFTLASGIPLTARVLGNVADVARGTNGTLRADYSGAPIASSNPSLKQWFNTAAFTLPCEVDSATGQCIPGTEHFGTAGRNTIIGPGLISVNMAMSKDIQIKDTLGLQIRVAATNVLNHVNYTGVDTIVNHLLTFGQVTSVGSMRTIQLTTRFRF